MMLPESKESHGFNRGSMSNIHANYPGNRRKWQPLYSVRRSNFANTCTKCGHSYTEELAKLPSQTNQADQTNQIEPANNGNEKDFIGTVTSVFLNVTDLAAKNFRISFWLMIQMLLKAVMQLW